MRTGPLRILAILLLFAGTYEAQASSNLFVASPNLLRVNSDEDVWVTLHHTQNSPATVKVYLENYPDRGRRFSEKTTSVGRDQSKKVTMRVGWADIPQGSQQTYVYLVAECQALGFKKESVILLSKTSGYLFLQTDKPIYNPHETVHIRVVSLNSEMKPSNLEITLDVINPNGDVIKRFPNRQATNGFVTEDFLLPKILTFGNWTLQASYKDTLQPSTTKTAIAFEVKEYVLPTFSVQVKILDDYILSSQAEVQFKITSNYVFGTPVKGHGTASFYLLSADGIELYVGFRPLDDLDEHVEAITRHEFGNNWFPKEGSRLLVKVTVTEGATGKQESATDSSAVFVESPFVISYERMPMFYRPGLPFTIKVDLTHPNKNAASGVPIHVEALVKMGGRQLGAHSNQVRVRDYQTDENGRQDITVDVPVDAGELQIKVTTDDMMFPQIHQTSTDILLRPHTSASNEYMFLQLRNTGRGISVNNVLEIRSDFTNAGPKKVNFMVVARGKILHHFVKAVNDRTTHENIQISPLMSPQARVIAYYASGSEIISDSLVLDIVKSCGNELTITVDRQKREYAPKDNVRLTLNAGKGSTVSVLGVDKAIYLLSEKDILTRSKMFKKMLEMDIGCGPGGGRDTSDVFKQAGLSIIATVGNVISSRRNTEGCSQNLGFRRRRGILEAVRDIKARLSMVDKTCCTHGVGDSIDASKSCTRLARNYGSRRLTCAHAFVQCCEAERRTIAISRGRSDSDMPVMQLTELKDEDVEIERRSDFRETWINELLTLGPSESSTDLTRALPDSITTWVISGVSVSPDQGMCVAIPTNITSRKTFFVHVDLPYAAVRTEQLEVKATVYNLGNRDIRVHVSLKADDSVCYAAEPGKYTYRQEIYVRKGSAQSVTFPIVPLKAKDQPSEIYVKALTAYEGDEVIKKLRIQNEGVKKSRTESIRLDPEGVMGDAGSGAADWTVNINKQNKRQSIQIPLKFPDDALPGTEACSVSIHGSLLGPMVPSTDFNISSKIKLPTGCGEQNMITMGLLVYATRYLLRTGKLTGELEANAYDHITKGYESQLAYKKKDGSFSAWDHYPASSWLTAFVTKVFCQASTFDQIGEKVLEHVIDTVNWLFKNSQDSRSGKFFETHVVMHKEMLGQSLMNDVTLTSFIVECISSCKDVIDLSSREFAYPLRRAVQYLEGNRYSQLSNPYGQAILTYALTLVNSAHRLEANERLRGMSDFDRVTGMRYWSLDGRALNHDAPSWYTASPPAASIEIASYALLTQLAISGQESYFTYGGPIASWLIRQRTKSGSFSSTTDTVLGLEALSEYASRANAKSKLDMHVRLFAGGRNFGENENLKLDEANALTPILIENNLPIGERLMVQATGTGMAQLQVECSYYAPPKDGEGCPFTLEVDSTEYKATAADLGPLDDVPPPPMDDDRSRFGRSIDEGGTSKFVARIQSRIRFNGGQKVGMSMLEVSLFTGFEPYMDDLKKMKKSGLIDQYEITGSSVLFYLKEISSIEDTFVTFRATQKYKVGKTQPVAVKVYDYYEPNARQCTKFYHPHARSALLAQSCEDSQGRKVCACVAGTCAEYWGFDRAHLPRGQRYKLKTRNALYREACEIYDYVVKVKAGERFTNKPLVEMYAEIEHVIKLGSDNLDTGETIHFVWNSECVYPLMEDGVSYLVMGMDGKQYIDKNGRAKTKYILDSSSHVVQWYGRERRGYMNALNSFAGKLVRRGCGQ